MNILFCGDRNIATGTAMASLSLARRISESEPLDIYILTAAPTVNGNRLKPLKPLKPLDGDFCLRLEAALADIHRDTRVRLFDVTELFEANPPKANLATHFTPCCMLRLYADLVPELPERILYVDNDVIFCASPDELYRAELDGAEVGGVLDYYGRWFYHRPAINIFRHDYLNSGVLLLDLGAIRRGGLFAGARELCAERRMKFPDQDAINRLAKKKIFPRRFNEQRETRPDTVIRHFSTTFRLFPVLHTVTAKPWQTERMHHLLHIFEYDEAAAFAAQLADPAGDTKK